MPYPGLALCREMRRALSLNYVNAWYVTWRKLARPFLDVIHFNRILLKQESLSSIIIKEKNIVGISRLSRKINLTLLHAVIFADRQQSKYSVEILHQTMC